MRRSGTSRRARTNDGSHLFEGAKQTPPQQGVHTHHEHRLKSDGGNEEIIRVREMLRDLTQEAQSLRLQRDRCYEENNRLRAMVKTLSDDIDDLRNENTSLRGDNEQLLRCSGHNSVVEKRRSNFGPENATGIHDVRSATAAICSQISSLSVADLLAAGLLYAGFTPTRLQKNNISRKIKWFKAFYGVEPTTVSPLFQDLKQSYPGIDFKDCLMTMNWLYLYESYPVLSGRWKYCEEYIAQKIMDYGDKMAKVAMKKIDFQLKGKVNLGRAVDCATFMVQEMRLDPSSKWFDYKTHSCGLKYEFCLATREPRVVWISGPHQPSRHDITVFRGGEKDQKVEDWDQNALYFQLGEGEKCVGDSGYAGEPGKVVVTKDEQSSELKEFLARAKNREETFHTRLKSFNVLGLRFRHGTTTKERMKLHKMAVEAISGIIQYDYENGHPPFDIC